VTGAPYDLRPCSMAVVRALCAIHHGYGSAGNSATYAFAVYEGDRPVAAYAWQPPPVGAARRVYPEAPSGVLVAVPRAERMLNHVSRPLRQQMRRLIDRGRWPVLVTYSDEGQGHTGHVYKCSGWERTERARRPYFTDASGARASSYSNGAHGGRDLRYAGTTMIQRWEHWACGRGGPICGCGCTAGPACPCRARCGGPGTKHTPGFTRSEEERMRNGVLVEVLFVEPERAKDRLYICPAQVPAFGERVDLGKPRADEPPGRPAVVEVVGVVHAGFRPYDPDQQGEAVATITVQAVK
jgi:hypothetical protein